MRSAADEAPRSRDERSPVHPAIARAETAKDRVDVLEREFDLGEEGEVPAEAGRLRERR